MCVMKYAIVIILMWIFPLFNCSAQNGYPQLKQKSDSLITRFEKELSKQSFVNTELTNNANNFFVDYNNELTGDTVWLENYEDFKFYRIKRKDFFFIAEYYTGKIGTLFECEKYVYYFYDGKLQMTQSLFFKHGEELDDYGSNLYVEEKRVLFSQGEPLQFYLVRDGEGSSRTLDIKALPFKQIDVKKVIYDKYAFETVGIKIFNGKTDF